MWWSWHCEFVKSYLRPSSIPDRTFWMMYSIKSFHLWKSLYSWINFFHQKKKNVFNFNFIGSILEQATNKGLKLNFENAAKLVLFWIKVKNEYLKINKMDSKVSSLFPSIYLSEIHFSTMIVINIKHGNSLDYTLFPSRNVIVNPRRLDKLTSRKQARVSH